MNISRLTNVRGDQPAAGHTKRVGPKANARRPEGVDAAQTGRTGGTASSGGVRPRLAAYAEKIENRFQKAIEGKDLTPRQTAALEKTKDKFQKLIQRLDNAYSDGATPKKSIQDSMKALLASFSKEVNHIFKGGEVTAPGGLGRPDASTATNAGRGVQLAPQDVTRSGGGVNTLA